MTRPTSVCHRSLRLTLAVWTLATLAACGGGGGGDGTPVTAPPPAVAPSVPASAASSPGTEILQINTAGDEVDVHADAPTVIKLHASGGDGNLIWTTDCGSLITCTIAEGELRAVSRAKDQFVKGSITFTVTDGKGARASRTAPAIVWPASLAGSVKSLVGATDRPGLHLLIVNDGFPPEELDAFHDTAKKFVDQFFSYPEIAAHRDAWNVHVGDLLMAPDPVTQKVDPSPLNTSLGCNGVARVLCLRVDRAYRAASLLLPHYTQILVIMNSAEYGGSGGGKMASITRNPQAVTVAVHELGHSFADLDDEYADDSVPGAGSYFVEGDAPNLTRLTDPQRIPWRLWINPGTALPTVGPVAADTVGLFEGGGYVNSGIYRPMFTSFMRELGQAIGPVNGEAWARNVYSQGGAWADVAPAVGTALAPGAKPAGGWIFKAQPLLNGTIAQTRWYVDGVERTSERGASQLLVTQAGAVQVRVDLVDVTSRVRAEQGVVSSLKWSVQ